MDFLIIAYIYMFILGSCIASFINVLIYRIPRDLDFVNGRSFCPSCHNTLKPYDMIPVFSWLFLKGKCRFCKEPISPRYPLIELCGGLLAMLCFYRYGFTWMTLVSFVLAMILLTITMIDFDTMTIPNGLVIALVAPVIVCAVLEPQISISSRVGLCLGFITLIAWRKMEHKQPIHVTGKTVLSIIVGVVGSLALGVGMCFSMVWGKMILGILIGLVGIVVLLCLIPLMKGIKD